MTQDPPVPGASGEIRDAEPPPRRSFRFVGSGSEYFGIWLANLLLTVLTLGVWSAWAKVRRLRYFYGNTRLAGHSFEFHGRGWPILLGRLIAVALLLALNLLESLDAFFWLAGPLLLLAALPWIAVRSLSYRARNTSYRTVRFDFRGRYVRAIMPFAIWRLLVPLSLGLLNPLAHRSRQQFSIRNHRWGGRGFHSAFSAGALYRALAVAVLVGIAAVGVFVVVVPILATLATDGEAVRRLAPEIFVLSFAFLSAVLMLCVFHYRAAVWRETARSASFDGGRFRLACDLEPARMATIQLTNLFATVATLGLFIPWAAVRAARYRIGSLSVVGDLDTLDYAGLAKEQDAAFGEEIGEFFDMEVGF